MRKTTTKTKDDPRDVDGILELNSALEDEVWAREVGLPGYETPSIPLYPREGDDKLFAEPIRPPRNSLMTPKQHILLTGCKLFHSHLTQSFFTVRRLPENYVINKRLSFA